MYIANRYELLDNIEKHLACPDMQITPFLYISITKKNILLLFFRKDNLDWPNKIAL